MALSDMREELRSLVNEPTTALMSDTQANAWLNEGCRQVSRRTECLEDRRSFSSVGYQRYYSHTTNFLRLKDMAFDQLHTVWPIDNRNWEQKTRWSPNSKGRPDFIRDWENKYEVYPRTSDDADTTTLSATIATATTTMTGASATGFDKMGRVLVGSEVIGYNNLTGAVFEGLSRGLEGTTDTSHVTAVTITKRDFIEDVYVVPNTMLTDAQVTSMPQDSFDAIYLYGQWKWYQKNKEPGEAMQMKNMFEDECQRLKSDLRTKQKRIAKTIKASDRYVGRL